MFYRVTADLSFYDPDQAKDFFHDSELALAKSSIINKDEPEEELGIITLQQCFHDDEVKKPCILLRTENNLLT